MRKAAFADVVPYEMPSSVHLSTRAPSATTPYPRRRRQYRRTDAGSQPRRARTHRGRGRRRSVGATMATGAATQFSARRRSALVVNDDPGGRAAAQRCSDARERGDPGCPGRPDHDAAPVAAPCRCRPRASPACSIPPCGRASSGTSSVEHACPAAPDTDGRSQAVRCGMHPHRSAPRAARLQRAQPEFPLMARYYRRPVEPCGDATIVDGDHAPAGSLVRRTCDIGGHRRGRPPRPQRRDPGGRPPPGRPVTR